MGEIIQKYRNYFKTALVFIFFLQGISLIAQDRTKLESDKLNNIEKLKLTRSLLDNTRQEYQSGSSSISILNRGIRYRESLIGNYEDEVNLLEYYIKEKESLIKENEKILDELKGDYGRIIKASYHNLDEEYWIMYLLSSQDINQGYQRIKYIKYLNDYRRRLFDDIIEKNDYLALQVDSLTLMKKEKERSLDNLEDEKGKLLKDRSQKAQMVSKLKNKEAQLLAEIKKRESVQKEIEDAIRKIIEEEARKAREANRAYALTPSEKLIGDDFGKNMGGLPWPTEQGIITGEYGLRTHPVLSGIKINSNGIDISTVKGAPVRAVFRGEVTKVVAIMGANYMVIIKHGNFRTIYQNVVDVQVKAGDMVETKEYIGKVGSDERTEPIIHFELWEKMETRNPESWLSK